MLLINGFSWKLGFMGDSDGFFRGKILDLIFENDSGENFDKNFDGEFESSFSEVRKSF